MTKRLFPLPFLASTLLLGFLFSACSSSPENPVGTPGTAGSTGTPGAAGSTGNPGAAGSTATAGTTGAAGTTGTTGGTTGTAGTTGTTGGTTGTTGGTTGTAGTSAGGMSGAGGSGGGSTAMGSMGCSKDPGADDSQTKWIKHDVDVTGVDPAFVTMYPPNAGSMYSWTHRNYFLRLPTGYDASKVYPITIGTSGCGGPETVGSEGGYAPLGVAAGETQAIQVALSYVLSTAANPDCGGAVFADDFVNSPEPAYLAAVVKDIESKYCVDAKKVFLSGYSAGAFEAIQLGCAGSDILRGYGTQLGGGLRGKHPACKGPTAAIYIIGNQDTENPVDAKPSIDSLGTGAARDELLTRNGCTGSAHMPWDAANFPGCDLYTGCPAQYPVVWCAIDSGHNPPPTDTNVAKYRNDALWKFWSTLP